MRWRGLEEVPDAAGEVAFEAAQGFAAGFAFGLFAGEVGGGVGVVEAFGDREAVKGAVDLAVAAAVEAVADRGARRTRGSVLIRRCVRASRRSRSGWMPAISPTSLAAIRTPQPRSASSCGCDLGDECGELALERVDGCG